MTICRRVTSSPGPFIVFHKFHFFQAHLSTSTLFLMGDKIESMDGDLNSALGMLRKNHQVGVMMTMLMTSKSC